MREAVLIRDLVDFAIGGGWGSDEPKPDSLEVLVIRGADFPSVCIGDLSTVPRRFEKASKAHKRILQPGDLILEVAGGTNDRPTGRSVFVSERMIQKSALPIIPASFCRLVRPRSEVVEPLFLYYWLQEMHASGRAWGYQVRSTGIANFQFEHFLDSESVLLPPLTEQRAIAKVLGALDDKIESNRTTIELASDLCDARFLDWRGRHLPLDVETSFGDFCDVFGGATPKTSEPDYWGGTHAWATPSDVTALGSVYLFGTRRTITDEGLDRCSASLHPSGSIFMTSRATIGAFVVNQIPCVPNQGFIVVRPKDSAHRWFLFHEMRRRVPEMLDRANGSTFQELSRGSFKEMSLLVPADDGAFSSLDRELSPLHERACIAARESEVATALRDALLPELLSGRIRVPEARELVEEAS
jgi:type I restriction enzyme S subunit